MYKGPRESSLPRASHGRCLGANPYSPILERPEDRDALHIYSAPSSRTIATDEDAPIRFAPASSMACTSASFRTPPDAFTPQRAPATPRSSATSATVAPPEANPVEVFRKSAPA